MYRTIIVAILVFGGTALADEGALPPDNLAYCSTCHGVQLRGNAALEAPRLGGLSAWYVEKQLRAFKAGWRGASREYAAGHAMRQMVLSLGDDEIGNTADYVSRTRSPVPLRSRDGDPDAGRALFGSCAACHGANGEGNERLAAPPLSGQNDWYLARQLVNFRDGVRGNHPDDLSGRQMQSAMSGFGEDRQIDDVVAYIMTLGETIRTDIE